MTETANKSRRHYWWSVGAAAVGVGGLIWVLGRVDYERLGSVVAEADLAFLSLLPLAIAAEQLVRAWKWRQLLHVIRPIKTLRLFGAIMAGYFANFLIPLGISPIVRSWLVARLEALRMSTVLATAAIDRLVDGVVFAGFVAVVLVFAVFPDPTGGIRLGLIIGGVGSLALFAALLLALARYKRHGGRGRAWLARQADRLPARYAEPVNAFMRAFADGIVWPGELWRSLGIVAASVTIKLIATTHFLWAGLAFGILLRPADYLLLVAVLGFLIIITRFARIPGGFFFGAIFALDALGVADEQALAMVLVVQASTTLTVCAIGAFALWKHGLTLGDLRGQDPEEEVWYFAFGANMHDSAFRERRGMSPTEWRAARVPGYRLRFNLEGRPQGRAAPANISAAAKAEVWGVLYRITGAELRHLDGTEGVPGGRYRHLWVDAEDSGGGRVRAVTYMADGNEADGKPSLRYITLLREGARAHGLPAHYLRFLDRVQHAK